MRGEACVICGHEAVSIPPRWQHYMVGGRERAICLTCVEGALFAALLATAPAEGFFARGDDGHYRTDPAPACACGIPGAGKARECHGDYYGGETFAMDPGGEFKETNVCKCGCHRDSAPAEEPKP